MSSKLIFASTLAPNMYCLCTPSDNLLEVLLERAKDDKLRAEPLLVAEHEIEFGPADLTYDEARMRIGETGAGMSTVAIKVSIRPYSARTLLVPVGECSQDDDLPTEGVFVPGIGCPLEFLLGAGLLAFVIGGGICAVQGLFG